MLALDLDGTLLNPAGKLTARTIGAVRDAVSAGVRVVVCTGRVLPECRRELDALGVEGTVIVAGGAMTCDIASGRTIRAHAMELATSREAIGVIIEHGHAALVYKDAGALGEDAYDYLTLHGEGNHPLHPVTAWWIGHHGIRARSARHTHEDSHEAMTVRVGACARAGAFEALSLALRDRLGERITTQHFRAVTAEHYLASNGAACAESVHILEVFAPGANKWNAVRALAAEAGVPSERIAAIGDEVNDVEMIKNAGLGVAMGNATGAVAAVAKRKTEGHDRDGAARAIERMLAGAW